MRASLEIRVQRFARGGASRYLLHSHRNSGILVWVTNMGKKRDVCATTARVPAANMMSVARLKPQAGRRR
jgi:hypothetical protein